MNFDQYTQNAQQAVADSQNVAIANGQQQLEVEHLHLALLQQREGLVPRLLNYMGLDVESLASEVQREIDRLPKVSGGGADQLFRAGEVVIRLAQVHVHLNTGNFHRLPPYSRMAVSRAMARYRSYADSGCTPKSPRSH